MEKMSEFIRKSDNKRKLQKRKFLRNRFCYNHRKQNE